MCLIKVFFLDTDIDIITSKCLENDEINMLM